MALRSGFTASALDSKAHTLAKVETLFNYREPIRHASGSPFEERLPPVGGRCRNSDRERSLAAKRTERARLCNRYGHPSTCVISYSKSNLCAGTLHTTLYS